MNVIDGQPSGHHEIERSENYAKAKHLIEEGIAASVAADSPEYWVKVQLQKTHLHEAKEVDMTLSQFLGGSSLSRMVSSKEYFDLLAEYNPINEAYQKLHEDESSVSRGEEVATDSTERKIGSTAAVAYKPVPLFESGHKQYRDARSAAAGDFVEDDE